MGSHSVVIEIDADTCDACPDSAHVAAFVYVEHKDWLSTLSYCAHHGTMFIPRLVELEAEIIDMRHLVTS